MKHLRDLLLLISMITLVDGAVYANALRATAKPTHVVFIFVYDAGETLGLLPIAPLLEAENVKVQWVPLTPWALRILEQESRAVVLPPEGLDQMSHVKDRMAIGETDYWLNLTVENKPNLVIFGLVSSIQEQLASEFRKRGIRTAGFYDAFDMTDRNSILWRVATKIDEIWVPTKKIKRNLNSLGLKQIKVMGLDCTP